MEQNYTYSQFVKVISLWIFYFLCDFLENGNNVISDPRIIENFFNTKTSAEEMIVDSIHEVLIYRTNKGVFVRYYYIIIRNNHSVLILMI